MIILGADLSYTRSAFVWLDSASNRVLHHTTLSVPTGPKRMLRAAKAFRNVVVEYGSGDLAIIEDVAIGAPSRTVVCKLTELSAMFKFVLESYDVDYLLVSPTLVKKFICGKGTAEKHIVARELKRKYKIEFEDDAPGYDLSDAAACAVYGLEQHV